MSTTMNTALTTNNIPDEMLALQRLYHWEKTEPNRIALTQPMGNGVVKDFTWAQVGDEVRRMAANLKSQGWEPGAKVAIFSKNCAWWMMSDLAIWMARFWNTARPRPVLSASWTAGKA